MQRFIVVCEISSREAEQEANQNQHSGDDGGQKPIECWGIASEVIFIDWNPILLGGGDDLRNANILVAYFLELVSSKTKR